MKGQRGVSVACVAIDKVQHRLSCLAAADVFRDDQGCGVRARFRRDVRRHGDAGVGPERVICGQRFDAEHVERGVCDLAAIESRQQGVVVDKRAAPRIDDDRALGQPRQRFAVQMFCVACVSGNKSTTI